MGALEVSSDHHRINCYSHDKASEAEDSSSDDDACDEVSMCVNLSVYLYCVEKLVDPAHLYSIIIDSSHIHAN